MHNSKLTADDIDRALPVEPPEPTPSPSEETGEPEQFWTRAPHTGSGLGIGSGYIYPALHAAMTEIRAVGKTGFNEQQRYNFRGIDGVVNAAGPAFRNHGIIPVPTLRKIRYRDTRTTQDKPTREVVVKVDFTFYALDGSNITVTTPGESLDTSDKGTAKAMSVAYRIALLQLLAIPTDEPDPDASYHTRDGHTELAATVERFILGKVLNHEVPLAQVTELWPIVIEHSAAERHPREVDDRTWFSLFVARYAQEIEAVQTYGEGKALKDTLRAANVLGWQVGQSTLEGLLTGRADFLAQRHREAVHEAIRGIEAAETADALDAVMATYQQLAAQSVIQGAKALDHLDGLAEARREHLAEPASGTTDEAPPERAPLNLEAFLTRAEMALKEEGMAVVPAIRDLLTGEWSGDPASRYGAGGFVAVRDTIAKAYGREKLISEATRDQLREELAAAVAAWGGVI